METSSYARIEPSGKLSYSSGNTIFHSSDEGLTWDETVVPLDFTSGHTRYKGLKNGNYILVTSRKMHYRQNGQWNLLLVEGDSMFNTSISVIEDKVILFRENNMYVYDDNTNEVNQVQVSEDYCCHWAQVFQNHFVVKVGDIERQIWTKDLQHINTIDFGESIFITKEGLIVKINYTTQASGQWGNRLEISEDDGQTFSLFHESDEEYRFIGEIDGRLYFRKFLSLNNAWLPIKNTSSLGYFDLQTREITEVFDGSSTPILADDNLYHRIGSTYFKYPEGDLNNRVKLTNLSFDARPIEKLRRASNGLIYALTRTFLYRSYDEGQTWENLLDFHGVEDIDLDDEDNLYCLSEGRILKSDDEGLAFSELPTEYAGGHIKFPHQIICVGSNKLIVKGLGDYTEGDVNDVGCWDCYDSYPDYVFMSDNDGAIWNPRLVSQGDYPLVTAADYYGYPNDQAIKSSYFVKTPEKVFFTGREYGFFLTEYYYGLATLDRSNLSMRPGKQPTDDRDNIRYGLTITGDLIRNDKGQISLSKNNGISYEDLSPTSLGDIFPGAAEESIYVISDDDNSEDVISYQADYGSPFMELDFKLQNTNEPVPNFFEMVYTDGESDYLFSETSTYKVVGRTSDVEKTALTEQDLLIKVYPNPVSELLNINIHKSGFTLTNIEIYDAKARLLHSALSFDTEFEVNMEDYDSGFYFVKVVSEDKIYNEKIFKL